MISREVIRLIYGVLLFLAFVIWLVAISGVAEAQSVTRVTAGGLIINMQDPQKIEFHCREGELVGPSKTKTAWVLSCKKKSNGGPPPPVDPPPSDCPDPSMPLVNQNGIGVTAATAPPLFSNQRKYHVYPGRWVVYRLNSDDYASKTFRSQVGPAFAPGGNTQSKTTTQVIGRCPGVFDAQTFDRKCFRSGGISNLDFGVNVGGNNCRLQAGNPYFLFLAPINPITNKATCTGKCGIVHNVQ